MSAGEEAVLVENGCAVELDVLRVETSDQRATVLDVVQQALGHERVLVQIHQLSTLHTDTLVTLSSQHTRHDTLVTTHSL